MPKNIGTNGVFFLKNIIISIPLDRPTIEETSRIITNMFLNTNTDIIKNTKDYFKNKKMDIESAHKNLKNTKLKENIKDQEIQNNLRKD